MRYWLPFFIVIFISYVTGCMVGPNFHSPKAPQTKRYTSAALPAKTVGTPPLGNAGVAQAFNYRQDIPAAWWQLFHSKTLNQLICTGLANSPTLGAAKATLLQAQENLRAQFGFLLIPGVTGQLGGQRQRFSGSQFGNNASKSIFNLYNASVMVNYTLDVFGGARRQIEALQAQVDYQKYELIGSYLTLTSNITTTAITIASLQAQIKATKALVAAEMAQLGILRKQFKLGGISAIDVLFQETQVSQSQALLPPLEKTLAYNQHALAVLIGSLPSQTHIPIIDLNKLHLPTQLPLSIPSRLVKQRPDVQAAEALLHAASAQIGVATANLFPQVSLTAGQGWTTTIPSQLFSPASKIWNYGSTINQTLFQGGALLANRRAAIAAFEAAYEQYRETVLQAFQNVADSLKAIESDARELERLEAAEKAAKKNLQLTRQQFQLGSAAYISLLIVQNQYQESVINRIQAQATRYSDTAALFQALGGGWWNDSAVKEYASMSPTFHLSH